MNDYILPKVLSKLSILGHNWKSTRLSNKLNENFKNNIKLTFISFDEVIIVTIRGFSL